MKRAFWITAYACALACFTGVTAYLVASWIKRGHLPWFGWVLILSSLLFVWIGIGFVRFLLHDKSEAGLAPADASSLTEKLG